MKEEIQKIFKGEVEDGAETLKKYSHDASVFEVRPAVVVYPKDSDDVQNLVRWVGENKERYKDLAITARCAGTDMSGGAIGESIIMDFTRHMNKLINFDVNKKEITVQPGMFYRDFEEITLEKNLILPCYTASKSINAMGGMYGNNSAGERTLKYGKTEDYITGAKVVFDDGNEYEVKALGRSELDQKIGQHDYEGAKYQRINSLIKENEADLRRAKPRVHKNSAGYYLWNVITEPAEGITPREIEGSSPRYFDLNKLLVGSQGTLGIATEITFKLVSDYKYSKLVAVFLNDLSNLGNIVDDILEKNPETLESYDDKTMKLATKFFTGFLKKKGFFGMIRFVWSFLPEFKMMLTNGFPKLILLVEFAGENEAEVHQKCLALVSHIKPHKLKTHITKNASEAEKYWDIRRDSFALLRSHVKGKRTAPFIDDIIVRPEFLPKFLPQLNKIMAKYKDDMTYTIAGHAGDGNFHIIPLMDFSKENTVQVISEVSEQVYELVVGYQGSITAEHNDGIIRTPYLPKMYEPHVIDLFRQVKNIFDHKNIFNPGKKVGGGKEYMKSHIAVVHPHEEHKS